MPSQDQLIGLSVRWQTSLLNVQREYLQHLFLSCFYQQIGSDHHLFKGGTALRIIFNSPRFSEDLDFSSLTSDTNELEEIIIKTLAQLDKTGIFPTISEAKPTTGGYFGILGFVLDGKPLSLQLNFSQRTKDTQPEIVSVAGEYISQYSLYSLGKQTIIAEKVQALLTRQKPRDFYDLYYILRANLLEVDQRSVLPKVLATLNQTKLDFDKELKVFLPQSHWLIIRDFKENLTREIKRFI